MKGVGGVFYGRNTKHTPTKHNPNLFDQEQDSGFSYFFHLLVIPSSTVLYFYSVAFPCGGTRTKPVMALWSCDWHSSFLNFHKLEKYAEGNVNHLRIEYKWPALSVMINL